MELIEDVTRYESMNGLQVASSRELFTCDSKGRRTDAASLGQIELRNFFFAD
ncbi:hypothetical protein GRAN_0481 [Granulicella sibirica]|uniref:Uncharacterized protein n=1 Tax=Granulicella sibirica TaxID=2479048 RepID=A0A4Q0T6H2_9BACT|nr:hypothetical protein GRAN_0481 [Granulicella sibirica]